MLKKILATTSVAAIIAGAAHAQLVLEQDTLTGTTIGAPYELAEEVDIAELVLAGNADALFGLEIKTQGVIPPGQNLFLTINVTNGSFVSNLDGSEFTAGITGAVVNSGGLIGNSQVRYLITTDTADGSTGDTGLDGVALNLPVAITSCADLTFDVSEFETESGGTPIEGGTAALTVAGTATPAVTCEDAFQATLAVDTDDTTLDFATAFMNFVDQSGPPVTGPDTADNCCIGRL